MRKTEKAYIAGFWDGEGTFCFLQNTHVSKDGTRGFVPWACVCNTNKEVLEYIQGLMGGALYEKRRHAHENRKLCYQLIFQSGEAERIAKLLLPLLRVKQEAARLLIGFPKRRGGGGGNNPEICQQQLAIVAKSKKLNKRGT